MRQVFRIMLSVVVLLGLFSVVSAEDGVEVIGGDEASLRSLVSHIAGQPVAEVIGGDEASLRAMAVALAGGGPGLDNQPVTVYVAALAKDMPFDLPLPENANLVGTVDRGQMGGITVMFDAPLAPQAIIDFYTDALNSDGWKKLEGFSGAGGFVTLPSSSQNFCYTSKTNKSSGVFINTQAIDKTISGTNISIYEQPDPAMCAGIGEGAYSPSNDPYSLLPQLQTPDGIEVLPQYGGGGGGGGGSGFRQASISAVLTSDMAIDAMLAAYNSELEAAGWESITSENSEHIAYSGWNLKDTKGAVWSGVFTLTATPAVANQYVALLTVQEIPPAQ